MKIYISKYRYHWISPYTILEKVLFWKDWENIDYDTPWVEKWSDRLTPISKAIQAVLDFIHPKIDFVKLDYWDTWSFDHTLAMIILPGLKQLKATKQGAPNVDDEDVPDELKSTSAPAKVNEWDTDENWFKRWDYVIDEMIFAFECKLDDTWQDKFYSGESDWQWKKLDETTYNPITGKEEGLSQMVEGPNHTFKCDYEGMKVVQNRITNGFRLFGKYYEGLWD
mgnify:FL=1